MAVTISFYNSFMLQVGNNNIDLDTDTFKAELYNASHVFTATHVARASVSANALATGNGYTNPGINMTSVTWLESAGVRTWDAADVVWTASGGSIGPAEHAVIYDDTSTVPSADLLVCSIGFGQAESAGDGTDFRINFNASGIFTV